MAVPELSERAQAIILVAVICASIAGLYGYIEATQPTAVRAASVTDVSLVVAGTNWTIRYGPVTTTNNTAYGILIEASQRLHFQVASVHYDVPSAMFVTGINGTANGQNGSFWQYWVDGVYGNVGADHYALANRAQVVWRFTMDQEGA